MAEVVMKFVNAAFVAALAVTTTGVLALPSEAAPLPTHVAAMKTALDKADVRVRYGGWGYRGWGGHRGWGWGAVAAGAIIGGAIAGTAYYGGDPYYGGGYYSGSYYGGGGSYYGGGYAQDYCPQYGYGGNYPGYYARHQYYGW
jgi:hypothetical protein